MAEIDGTVVFKIHPPSLCSICARYLANNIQRCLPRVLDVYNRGMYIGCQEVAQNFLRAVEMNWEEKVFNTPKKVRFDKTDTETIGDVFSFMFLPSKRLCFPPSTYLPTLDLLYTHLLYHGERLTDLTLTKCYSDNGEAPIDRVLEIIGSLKVLQRLTLPLCNVDNFISEKGLEAAIKPNSEITATLRELNLIRCGFSTMQVLLRMLSRFIHLQKLILSTVIVKGLDQQHPHLHQILPVPLNGSLSKLEDLEISHFRVCPCFYRDTTISPKVYENIGREWKLFTRNYPSLKSLQVRDVYDISHDKQCLIGLRDGLRERKKPLAYLSFLLIPDDPTGRDIVRGMNAVKINSHETINDVYYEMINSGSVDNSEVINAFMLKLSTIRDRMKHLDIQTSRSLLAILDAVIPRYRHLSYVFYQCLAILLSIVKKPRLRSELKLVPAVIERFIHLLVEPESEHSSRFHFYPFSICDILAVYQDAISTDVFEKVMRQVTSWSISAGWGTPHYEMYDYLDNLSTYCTLAYIGVLKKILGGRDRDFRGMTKTLVDMFDWSPERVKFLVAKFKARESRGRPAAKEKKYKFVTP